MQKGGKKKYDLYLHNPKHHTVNLHKTFYAMSIQSKQSEHRHTIWVCSNYVTEFSLALRIHTYGLAGPGFFSTNVPFSLRGTACFLQKSQYILGFACNFYISNDLSSCF